MATYVNFLRLTELATGEGSGTWGNTTNTNLELIGEALGYATQQAFGSDADATTTVADGVSDPARAMYYKITSAVSLTTTRTLTIAPNTLSRVMFIENATSGSQSIAISQGSGANVTILTGKTAVVYLDGAGAGAAVVDAMAGVDPGVTDTLAEVLTAGNTTTTDQKVQFRDSAIYINSSADGQLDIVADTEIQIAATTIDVNGTLAFDSLKGTGATTVTNILDEDNMASDSATAIATQQSIKAYVDSQVGTVDTLSEILANGNTTGSNDIAVDTTQKVQFRDSAIYINSSADGQLDLVADTEIQIAATTIDINGAINASGEIIAASLDISGDIDVDGTTNLDVVDIDGAVDMASTLAVANQVTITKTGTNAAPHIKLTESGDTREFNIFNDGSGNGRLVLADSDDDTPDTEIVLADNGQIQFKTSTIERLNVDAGGDISFYEDTGTTPKLFWDASEESLGIGTSSPREKVHLHGGLNSTQVLMTGGGLNSEIYGGFVEGDGVSGAGGFLRLGVLDAGAERVGIEITAQGNEIIFDTAATERMRIDASGNVGIGAAPSAWASAYKVLQLGSASSMFNTGSGTLFATNAYIDSGFVWRYQNSSYSSRYTMESGGHAWYNAPSGTAGDAVGFTQVMTLDASGNLDTTGRVKTQSDLNVYGGNSGSTANRVALCMEGAGAARILVNGPDAGTYGSFKVDLASSSGTVGHTLTYDASGALVLNNSGGDAQMYFGGTSGTNRMYLARSGLDSLLWNVSNGVMRFGTNNAEAMRIDQFGSLNVSRTAYTSTSTNGFHANADGWTHTSVSGEPTAYFNRNTSDGDVVKILKDGTTVGSIGVNASNLLQVSSASSGGLFLADNSTNVAGFVNGENAFRPAGDNTISLGKSDRRFKDLYLSGGVYLGGTGAANKLDDYEEGTWTPVDGTGGVGSGGAGVYTKIGRLVHVSGTLVVTAFTGGNTDYAISGLPFTVSTATGAKGITNLAAGAAAQTPSAMFCDGTTLYVRPSSVYSGAAVSIYFSATYIT